MNLSQEQKFKFRLRFEQEQSSGSQPPKSLEGFAKNAIKDYGSLMQLAVPGLEALKVAQGTSMYNMPPKELGRSLVEGVKGIPRAMANTILHPIESAYERPVSTALDIGGLAAGVPALANAGRSAASAVARRVLPGATRITAGIPEKAMGIALKKPLVLSQPPVPAESLNRVVGEPLIEAVKSAKQRVQGTLGKAYQKYAGVGNPINELIEGKAKQPLKTFEQLADDYKSAKTGELFNKPNLGGGKDVMSSKEKLATLTHLKRNIQSEANFNRAPVTLQPIDTVKDAALKKMGSEVDAIRSTIPNGKKLAMADDAYKSINDIYDTVRKDLSDPGKARDTMMRLLRGDNTWLTTGRMQGKVNAIRQAEKIVGKKILEPALEELTRQVFNEWMGKGFVSHAFKAGAALTGLANPAAAATALAASSPRVIRGGIKAAQAVGGKLKQMAPIANKAVAVGGAELATKPLRLTEEKAKEFYKKAKKQNRGLSDEAVRQIAREDAKKKGYEIPIVDD